MGKNKSAQTAGKGGGGQGASENVKPRAPKHGGSSKASNRYLYAGVALLVGVAAVGFQFYSSRTVPAPPEPEAPESVQRRAQAKPVQGDAPPRRKPKAEMQPPTPKEPRDPNCVDSDDNCAAWAKGGECDRNPEFMKASCRASCHVCNGGKPRPKKANACEDSNTNCATWAAIGECQSNPGFMLANCPVTCKMCQSETCFDALPDCKERCRGGAASNFSESVNCYYEPELVEKCAWTCGACKEHRFDKPSCKRRAGVRPAAVSGSVNSIFQRIADEEPGATVLSSPQGDGPWVITIDDFLSDAECEAVKAAGSNQGSSWARSQAGDGVQAARTSSTAWCKGTCLGDPTIQTVEKRVSDLLRERGASEGIPMENAEPMQVGSEREPWSQPWSPLPERGPARWPEVERGPSPIARP